MKDNLGMGSTNSPMHKQRIGEGHHRGHRIGWVGHLRTPEPPTPRATAIAGDDRTLRDRRSHTRLPWPPPPLLKPTAPHATAVPTGPRVHRLRSSASGAPSPLARPPWELHRRSVLGEQCHCLPASLESATAAHPRDRRRSHIRGNRRRR
jgi:hypothetical protein